MFSEEARILFLFFLLFTQGMRLAYITGISANQRRIKVIVGGKSYRQHQSFKTAIRERDNHTCQICGNEGWIIDHIIPYAISHETRPEGVRVLCHSCNLKLRRKRRDARLDLNDWLSYLNTELRGELI